MFFYLWNWQSLFLLKPSAVVAPNPPVSWSNWVSRGTGPTTPPLFTCTGGKSPTTWSCACHAPPLAQPLSPDFGSCVRSCS